MVASLILLVSCDDVQEHVNVNDSASAEILEDLGRRPLRLPEVLAGEPCEAERYAAHIKGIPAEGALGRGPVMSVFPSIPRGLDLFRPDDGALLAESRWRGAEVLFVSEPRYDGPVLVRGGQIDGERRVGFGDQAKPMWELKLPLGNWESADGLRVWGDRKLQPVEADAGTPACPRCLRLSNAWRVQRATLRIAAGGCYAMQLDGLGFSQVIEFGAIWQPGSN